MLPEVNPESSLQNAWVQDWLIRWDRRFPEPDSGFSSTVEATTEEIQGTFNYQEKEQEEARLTQSDLELLERLIRKFLKQLEEWNVPEHSLTEALRLSGAFAASTRKHQMERTAGN